MPDHVEEAAAAWALRHPLDAAGRAELEAWLAQDRRHAGALLRAQAGLSVIDHAVARDAPIDVEGGMPSNPAPTRRWLLAGVGGAMAAGIAAIVAWPHLMVERVTTARGEIRRLPLADGSVATIDTSSVLRVAMADDSRRIALQEGQAWFQVAKDRKRPFVVDAGIAQVRAVGTAFSVRRAGNGVRVAVTEGRVAAWATDSGGTMTILEAGQYATFRPGAAGPEVVTAPAAIERSLAWRSGEIALENETLGSAVEQFNRYNQQQLVIVDGDLAGARLVGLFRIDRPGDFAATLSASLDVTATTTPAEIRLVRKKNPQP
ncbi:FecR domain-containing protein [Sphingomonas sp. BT-65]|uniref:FecR family protein n=1 Tax=Sphingomonas sp. BT-65 TaxID=2989821 RepID=UPI002235F19B|nr:FecR domain-containing protein [Sphingomonas sp. BT-65]MCW4460240.1 FecR domain-containing protein [Sphingomonas sp. BT-65]